MSDYKNISATLYAMLDIATTSMGESHKDPPAEQIIREHFTYAIADMVRELIWDDLDEEVREIAAEKKVAFLEHIEDVAFGKPLAGTEQHGSTP